MFFKTKRLHRRAVQLLVLVHLQGGVLKALHERGPSTLDEILTTLGLTLDEVGDDLMIAMIVLEQMGYTTRTTRFGGEVVFQLAEKSHQVADRVMAGPSEG